MSLKENLDFVKQEISSEEKFFENFFKIEKFYNKYKIVIIVSIIGILGYFIGNGVLSYIKEQDNIASNIAYNKLLKEPNDQKSIAILKDKNKILLDLAIYKIKKDTTQTNNIIYLKQIALFNKAIKNNDIKVLDSLILNQDFLLREYALFNKALILIMNKNYSKAKQTIKLIKKDTQLKPLINALEHFLVTK